MFKQPISIFVSDPKFIEEKERLDDIVKKSLDFKEANVDFNKYDKFFLQHVFGCHCDNETQFKLLLKSPSLYESIHYKLLNAEGKYICSNLTFCYKFLKSIIDEYKVPILLHCLKKYQRLFLNYGDPIYNYSFDTAKQEFVLSGANKDDRLECVSSSRREKGRTIKGSYIMDEEQFYPRSKSASDYRFPKYLNTIRNYSGDAFQFYFDAYNFRALSSLDKDGIEKARKHIIRARQLHEVVSKSNFDYKSTLYSGVRFNEFIDMLDYSGMSDIELKKDYGTYTDEESNILFEELKRKTLGGKIIKQRIVTSTSKSPHTAIKFAIGSNSQKNIGFLLEINVENGYRGIDISQISVHKNEEEIILDTSQKFAVKDIELIKDPIKDPKFHLINEGRKYKDKYSQFNLIKITVDAIK